MEHKLVL